jgi:4-hydroxy-tetrahydrodipicolinate reductase
MNVKKGTVACVSYSWTAFVKDKPFYTTEVFWYLGQEMRPEFAVGDDCWTVTIEGRPSIKATIESKGSFARNLKMLQEEPAPPGYLTTVVAMIQAVPMVISAPPGLLLPSAPEVHWKTDMRKSNTPLS